jgi:hypothetical protein
MLTRKAWIQLVTKLGIGVGALGVVGVLLAAIPNHHAPSTDALSAEAGQESQSADHAKMRMTRPRANKAQCATCSTCIMAIRRTCT